MPRLRRNGQRMNPRRLLAVLAIAAAAVLLVVRLAGSGAGDPSAAAASSPAATLTTVEPTLADPTAGAATPTLSSPAVSRGPSSAAPASFDTAGATAAAAGFAKAWVRPTDPSGWTARLTALSTPELAGKLQAANPATVPASTIIGAPQITATPAGADASITTDTGTLRLALVRHGHWQVDTVDWTPAR